ncbi:hypothetical protein HZA55_10875 [Candidatus Poribacteria bacterium]|nr:hypothetical protein [Candidatus Poribacteria bacterium]
MNFEKIKKVKKIIILWLILLLIVFLAFEFQFDKKITSSLIILYGLATPIFSGMFATLGTLIAAIPWLGPILLKLIALPISWILNGIAYLGSLVLVSKGETKKAIDARILSIIFFIGFLLGYIIGKVI